MQPSISSRTAILRPSTPLILFDGDCGLCIRVALGLAERHGVEVAEWRPWQGETTLPPGVSRERLEREIVMIRPDGKTLGGYRVFREILCRTPRWRAFGLTMWIPGVQIAANLLYRAIAARRRWVSQRLGFAACILRSPSDKARKRA